MKFAQILSNRLKICKKLPYLNNRKVPEIWFKKKSGIITPLQNITDAAAMHCGKHNTSSSDYFPIHPASARCLPRQVSISIAIAWCGGNGWMGLKVPMFAQPFYTYNKIAIHY